ncbi:hypothetical protein, partial [Rhodoplanes sp. SY1]|uniref:hypothetical protein n=1 Tax=Rhodoplanes sp. SY1 TaxID=3166646 RepID=UPI0038B588ED
MRARFDRLVEGVPIRHIDGGEGRASRLVAGGGGPLQRIELRRRVVFRDERRHGGAALAADVADRL